MKYLICFTLTIFINFTTFAVNQLSVETQQRLERDILLKEKIHNQQQAIDNKGLNSNFLVVGAPTVINPRSGSKSRSSCDYTNIQDAIDDAKLNDIPEIRIAKNKDYIENLTIVDMSIELIGGYSSCELASIPFASPPAATDGNRVKIENAAGSTLPIIRIQGNTLHNSVTIKNFWIRDGSSGGIRTLSADVTLSLDNLMFYNNNSSALRIQGGSDTEVMITKSIFFQNPGTNGGAIQCENGGNLIVLAEDSSLVNNTATGAGGAVYLESACDFSMYGGTIANNTTGGKGGGIYAEFGSDVILYGSEFCSGSTCLGSNQDQISLGGNIANSDGGAIYAEDGATTVNAVAAKFLHNQSTTGRGGAIALYNGASFTMKRIVAECEDMQRCNFFDGNKAATLGGAIYKSSSSVDISSTYFEDNRADAGTALYSTGVSSSTKIEGSIFNHNGDNAADGFSDQYVIRAFANANIDITYSTFADNNAIGAVFGVYSSADLDVFSSIIYDPSSGDVFHALSSSLSFHCLIVHETDSFDVDGEVVTAESPYFIDAANRDYHINPALSPAVDYCTDAQAQAVYEDIDFEDRGYDDVLIQNNTATNGTFDIGADETQGSDIIFKDGFE